LLAFLSQQREVMRMTAYGLTDDQARTTSTRSPLTVGGLIKHVALTERGWMGNVLQLPPSGSEHDYVNGFQLGPDESLAEVLALYDEVAKETEATIADIVDLGQPVPVPPAPWYPPDLKEWSVRWVLLHLIEETARHAGHADIIREGIDGATAFPLMAAAEGWPETPWLKPWRPPAQE
jgi:uncharacterized damage-inducible protein DinB